MSETLVRLLLFDALTAAAGRTLLAAAGWPVRAAPGRTLGLAYLTGTAWIGIGGSLVLIAGGSLSIAAVTLLLVAPLALLSAPRPEWISVRGGLWFAAPAVTAASLVAIRGTSSPMRGWDAWSFWTPRAVSIIKLGGLQPTYLHSGVPNPDYPPLLPALEAVYLRVQGTADTTLIHMQLGLLLVAFVATVAVVLLGQAPNWCLGCVLFLLATAPTVYSQTLDAYADVPLAIFTATAALFAWAGLTINKGASVLAVLFFAAAMLTKVEGAVLAAVVVAAVVVTRRSPRPVAWGARVFGSSIGISFLPWHLWLRINDVSGPYHFEWGSALGTARAFSAADSLAAAVTSPSEWLLLPLVVGVAVAFALSRTGATEDGAFVVFCLAGALIAFDLIYAGTSYPFSWHVHTSVSRVIDTPMFVAAIFVPLLLAPAIEETRASAPESEATSLSGSRWLRRAASRDVST